MPIQDGVGLAIDRIFRNNLLNQTIGVNRGETLTPQPQQPRAKPVEVVSPRPQRQSSFRGISQIRRELIPPPPEEPPEEPPEPQGIPLPLKSEWLSRLAKSNPELFKRLVLGQVNLQDVMTTDTMTSAINPFRQGTIAGREFLQQPSGEAVKDIQGNVVFRPTRQELYRQQQESERQAETIRRSELAQSPDTVIRMMNTPTVVFGLTPSDMAGVGVIAGMGIQGAKALYDRFLAFRRLPQYRAIEKFARAEQVAGRPINPQAKQQAQNAIRSAFNLYKRGMTEAADEIMAAFNRAYSARFTQAPLPRQPAGLLGTRPLPAGTQTGAVAFGGKRFEPAKQPVPQPAAERITAPQGEAAKVAPAPEVKKGLPLGTTKQFEVRFARKKTGEMKSIVVQAPDEVAAVSIARKQLGLDITEWFQERVIIPKAEAAKVTPAPEVKPSFIVDTEGKIARVTKWDNEGNPSVIYPGKSGGIEERTGLPFAYKPEEGWRPATPTDFSRMMRPSKSAEMIDLRMWQDELGKSLQAEKRLYPMSAKERRREIIEARIKRGETVPPKLLAEFPDLAIPKAEPEFPVRQEIGQPEAGRGISPPPTQPPTAQEGGVPDPVPPSGRPRTLADLNREAKGMRAISPENRAAIMDVARPISEGELLYQVKPFEEHARNLLQPDTPIKDALRRTPGWRQVAAAINPAQMNRDNPVAMIGVRKQIFEEIEIGRARLATLNWWHDADEAFNFKKVRGKWRATNMELTASAAPSKPYHATIHDLVEHPENYNFTPEQQKVLGIAQDMQRQIMRDAQRVGVNAVELFNDYWRRIVIKAPKAKLDAKIRSRIAQRKGYTRQRVFDFVDEGAKAGYEYETHPLTALQNRLEAGIRTISDQETRQAIARLPGVEKPLERLESRYPQTVEGARQARHARDAAKIAFLRDKTVENETALRQAEADFIMAMKEFYSKKLEAGQPYIGELKLPNGRIAPAELVEEVRKWVDLPEIQTSVGAISSNVLEVTRLVRTTLTNVDLAAGFIQGQALFYRNNVAWWRAQANAIVALIDDPVAFVHKNFPVMDEGMRVGAISIPTEFLFTRQGLASIPTRIPVIGPVMKAFNRAFEWFILTGQTELYKAARGAAIRRAGGDISSQKATDALVSLGSAIRKELGTESYAILGVRPTQHTFEQLVLFAARFFRALTGFQAQAFTGGEGGHEARRGMASLLAGGLALTIAVSYAKDRELPNLTDPFKPGWMSVKIGKTYFNFFGPFYPYLRTQARVGILVSQGKFDKAAQQLNWFMQSKAGLPLRGIDMAAQFGIKGYYTTFEGKTLPKTPAGIGEAVLGEMVIPISIQEALESIPEGRPEAFIGELFGLVGRENYPYFPEEMLAPYFDIPTSAIELRAGKEDRTIRFSREEYREYFPQIDAMLFLKGYVTTIKTDRAKYFVLDIVKREGYDPLQMRAVKQWQREQDKLKEAGLRAQTITLTDRLIMELLGLTRAVPGTSPSGVPDKEQFRKAARENLKRTIGALGR